MKFLKTCYNIKNKNNYNLDCIINHDEAPVFLDSPYNDSIAKKSIHIIIIKALGGETARLTILLTIALRELN